MEKIQSALAKARAERGEKTSEPAKDSAVSTPQKRSSRPTASGQILKNWEAVPTVEIDDKHRKRNRLVAAQGRRDSANIDMLRTRTLQQMRDNSWRRLAITSPSSACGKSTVALNLALSLQLQSDLRIILIELDLRRPSLSGMVGIQRDISFADVLQGKADFADNVVRHGDNLLISCNQRPRQKAAELLASDNVPDVLAEIEAAYEPDVVIFDTPPMLVTDDMMAFARHVDCALLVAGAEATTVKELDICETDLASQTNVMGVVLNKCRYMGPEYGYGYDNYE